MSEMTLAPACLEWSQHTRFTITPSSSLRASELQDLIEDPEPPFYFKVLFLSSLVEVRFAAQPKDTDFDALVTRVRSPASPLQIAENSGFDFENATAQLFDGQQHLPLKRLNQVRSGALLELCVAIDTPPDAAPSPSGSVRLNATVRSTSSKVKAKRTNLLGPRGTLDSPPEPPIAKRIAATRSPLSATTEEERYIYEVQESETGESVQDAGELLDLTPQQTSPDYTSKFVVSMYEDYAIVQLKLKSRQGVKRRFRCPFLECRKVFNESGNLRTHIRSHTNERPYQCTHCPQTFIAKGHLDSHMLKHNGRKPFICPHPGCGKAYSRANRLKVHERNHTGQRPFVCDLCNKSFTDKTNLVTHLRIHSGERPFKCEVCEKTFVKQSHLSDHQKCHEVTKNFQCDICGNTFKRKRTLNYHITHKHPAPASEMSLASFAEPVRRPRVITINNQKLEPEPQAQPLPQPQESEQIFSFDTSKCQPQDYMSSFTIPTKKTSANTAGLPSRSSLDVTPHSLEVSLSRKLFEAAGEDELGDFLLQTTKLIENSQDRSMATPISGVMPQSCLDVPQPLGGSQMPYLDDLNFANALHMFSAASMPSPFQRGAGGRQTPLTNGGGAGAMLTGTLASSEPQEPFKSPDSLFSSALAGDALGTALSSGGFSIPEVRRQSFLRSCSNNSLGKEDGGLLSTLFRPSAAAGAPTLYSMYTPDSSRSLVTRYQPPPASYSPLLPGGQGFSHALTLLSPDRTSEEQPPKQHPSH